MKVVTIPLPVMLQYDQGVGQSLAEDHSHQPDGKEGRAGKAVDATCDHTQLGCRMN